MSARTTFVGREYREFDSMRRWELLFEEIRLVILDTGLKRGRDVNLIGIASSNLRVLWEFGGAIRSDDQSAYDGVTSVHIKGGAVWVCTWGGMHCRIDYRTGEILEGVFLK